MADETSDDTEPQQTRSFREDSTLVELELLRMHFRPGTEADPALLNAVGAGCRVLDQLHRYFVRSLYLYSFVSTTLSVTVLWINLGFVARIFFQSSLPALMSIGAAIIAWTLARYRARSTSTSTLSLRAFRKQEYYLRSIALVLSVTFVLIAYFHSSIMLTPLSRWVVFTIGSVALYFMLGFVLGLILNPAKNGILRLLNRRLLTEDALVAKLISAAHSVLTWPSSRQNDETLAFAISIPAEYCADLHNRRGARHLDEQTRQWLRNRGRKIANTISRHAGQLYAPGYSNEQIARSLFNVAMTLHEGDWDGLTQIEIDTSLKSIIRRYAPRIMIAAAIFATALVLPLIDGIVPSDSVGYVRTTLLLTAFFALFVTDTGKLGDTALGLTKDIMRRQ